MTRRHKKRLLIFLIVSAIIFIIGGFYFNFQNETKKRYNDLKNGESVLAQVVEFEDVDYRQPNKWRFIFTVEDVSYTSSTIGEYTLRQMDSLKNKDGKLLIQYVLKDGKVVLDSEAKAKIKETEYPIALSAESQYFIDSRQPSITATIVIFIGASVCLLYALFNLILMKFYASIEEKGEFAYAVFIEAYPSKFGSNRYMAIRYKYKNMQDEWVEAVSPYSYSPMSVEILKNLEAFGVRYSGKHSVIVENVKNIAMPKI